MATTPSISSETMERQAEARDALSTDIQTAVEVFVERLADIAREYKRSEEYVHLIAGIGGYKLLKKGHSAPSIWGIFCGSKLREANENKEWGEKITLKEFLPTKKGDLRDAFDDLSDDNKKEMIEQYYKRKGEKKKAPKNHSNISISKTVDARMKLIATTCHNLNQTHKTECLLLFCRGNSMHTYPPFSFATEGALQWLQHAEIGHNEPYHAATQMEGFTVLGCSKRVQKAQAPAKVLQAEIVSYCRNMILEGLKDILVSNNVPHAGSVTMMNYPHYEDKIVERFGVELVGWPLDGSPRNPGTLTCDEAATLRDALARDVCRWTKLSDDQVDARKASNKRRVENGEMVYGPPRKKRARKTDSTNSSRNEYDANLEMDEGAA